MSILIAGIHTGIGKTICSAILCQSLRYDYWKPVQAGDLEQSDTVFIQSHVTNPTCMVHPEAFTLRTAMSPHHAADLDGTTINPYTLTPPKSPNKIVIEMAGGVLTPLSHRFTNIDLAVQMRLPVVLVSSHYLGSINHTLLSVDALRRRNIKILGLVFSGKEVPSSQSFILSYTQLPLLFSIPYMQDINPATIAQLSRNLVIPSL